MVWGIIGPSFLNDEVDRLELKKYVKDYTFACQIGWYETQKFVQSDIALDESKPCLHLFGEMWKTNKLARDGKYPNGSIYERLKSKHYVDAFAKEIGYKEGFSEIFHGYCERECKFIRSLKKRVEFLKKYMRNLKNKF